MGDAPDTIRARIPQIKAITETCYMQFAYDLWNVYHLKLYTDWGFNTFDDYVMKEVGISKDSSYRLRRIFGILVMKCGLRPNDLEGLGRSKAERLIPYVTRENASKLVSEAKRLNYGSLVIKLERLRAKQEASRGVVAQQDITVDATSTPATTASTASTTSTTPVEGMVSTQPKLKLALRSVPPGFKTKTFCLPEDTYTLLDEALAEAQRISKSASDGFNLGCILQHFLGHRLTTDSADDGRLKWFMRGMERVYGGRLLWIKDDRAWDVLRKAIEANNGEGLFGFTSSEEENLESSNGQEARCSGEQD